MKKYLSHSYRKYLTLGVFSLFFLGLSTYALSIVTEGWKASPGSITRVDVRSLVARNREVYSNVRTDNCKDISIAAGRPAVFVPTGNVNDWNSFRNNAPNNNIGVTLTNCSATPSCNNNGIKDNGETGIDCGGGSCAACVATPVCGNGVQEAGESCDDGAVNSNSTPGACYTDCSGRVPSAGSVVTGPTERCVFYAGNYYKVNYYTQTNPDSGLVQDQQMNISPIGMASFQGYMNGDATWAIAVQPPTAYTDSNCTPVSTPSNTCLPPPSFPNIGSNLTYNPTSPNQTWSYSTSGGSCTYTCVNGYSEDGCAKAPIVHGACGSADGQSSGNNPLTNGGDLCATGNASGGASDPMTGTATWQCDGSNGGTNKSCSAKYSVTGWCSAAEGQTYAILPPQLCYRGAVISGPDGGYMRETDSNSYPVNWSWSCGGLNGGSSIPCEAIYAPITSGGGDGGGDGGGCGGAGGSCGGE